MIPRHWQRVPRLDGDRYTLVEVARDTYGPENVRRQDMNGDDLFWRTPKATYFMFFDLKQKTHLLKIDKEGKIKHFPKAPLRLRIQIKAEDLFLGMIVFGSIIAWTIGITLSIIHR